MATPSRIAFTLTLATIGTILTIGGLDVRAASAGLMADGAAYAVGTATVLLGMVTGLAAVCVRVFGGRR